MQSEMQHTLFKSRPVRAQPNLANRNVSWDDENFPELPHVELDRVLETDFSSEYASGSVNSRLRHALEQSQECRLILDGQKMPSTNDTRCNPRLSGGGYTKLSTKQRQPLSIHKQLTPSPLVAQRARYDAVRGRLKEVEKENFELKRRLVGLTPKCVKSQIKSEKTKGNIENCTSCQRLAKQKRLQAEYFEEKLLKSRQDLTSNRRQCKELQSQLSELQPMLTKLQDKYESTLAKVAERTKMYKSRTERLERHRNTDIIGFRTDIGHIKRRLKDVEKSVVQANILELCVDNK